MAVWDDIHGGSDRVNPSRKVVGKQKKLEKKLSYRVAEHLAVFYPDVEFRFDVAADMKLTKGQAVICKQKLRHNRGYQDLTILEARGGYFGLLIELKKDKSEVFCKDGRIKKKYDKKTDSDRNLEQFNHLSKMRSKGYFATYGFGFEDTERIISEYMAKPYTELILV
jgi:hypothetical protein